MRAPREKDVQKLCLAWLRLWGALPVRINSGALKIGERFVKFNSESGCADTLVCLPPNGRFLSLEVKHPGRDTTTAARKVEQAAHRARVVRAGGLAIVVQSLRDLQEALVAAGYDVGRVVG